ncbi:MAG: sulfotransferase [Bacteroidota bacterium]
MDLPSKSDLSHIPIFFIIGRTRSGTTLLRTLFDAHPNVTIPVECPFIGGYYLSYGKRKHWNAQRFERFVDYLMKTRKFSTLNISREQLLSHLLPLAGTVSYATICKTIISLYPSVFPKEEIQILGDKNPVYSLYFRYLPLIFPEARYIHLVRDYRDQILSTKAVDFEFHNTAIIAYKWKKSVRILERAKKKNPELFHTVKYEDLTADPVIQVQNICRFLNIPYQSSMLSFHEKKEGLEKEYSKYSIETHHKSLIQPINTRKVDLWKNQLSEREINMADQVAGKWSEKMGYDRNYNGFNLIIWFRSLPSVFLTESIHLFVLIVHYLPFTFRNRILNRGPLLVGFLKRKNKQTK